MGGRRLAELRAQLVRDRVQSRIVARAVIGPNSNSRVTSRHLRSGEDRDVALHVEIVAAVGVDVVPDQRGNGVSVAWRESIGPMGLGENLLKHEGVDEDHAVLKQAQTEHANFPIPAPIAAKLAASGEEHGVIGAVPVLDDVEPIADFRRSASSCR